MNKEEYESVVNNCRLTDGTDFSIPIVLPVKGQTENYIHSGQMHALVDFQGTPQGLIDIQSVFRIDPASDAEKIFGTADARHPGVSLFLKSSSLCAGGDIFIPESAIPSHRYYRTPREIRRYLAGCYRLLRLYLMMLLH